MVRGARRERLHHQFDRAPGPLGQLERRRGTAELGIQRTRVGIDAELEVLDRPWHVDRPAVVAEVALDLADDGRHGERREREPTIGIEPVDRLQQAEGRHLLQVVAFGLPP